MQISKKINLGLSLFIFLIGLLSVFAPNLAHAATTFRWQGNNIVGSDNSTFQPVPGTDNFVLVNQTNNGVCESTAIIRVNRTGATGTLYPLGSNADARSRGGLNVVDPYDLAQYLQDPSKCKGPGQSSLSTISISGTAPSSVNPDNLSPGAREGEICSQQGATAGNLVCGNCSNQGCVWVAGTATGTSGNACEENNNTGFEWIICGVLRGVDDLVTRFNHVIEGQMNFNVKQNLIDPQGIHQAWNTFRILASSLLVIIMLVMVFSQAISAGPFDAYTVRKLLPRLVAAVILIQISWVLGIYLVRVANDLGNGIASLLAAPFGGTDQLNFDKLLGELGSAWPAGVVGVGFLAGAVALIINPFGALMLAFIVFMGLIVALAVLLIRQALIIACIIFMPVAFVAWILPGTQKYWKLLWDNFVKALLLFPIIIGLIYIGRIFAWIVGVGGSDPGVLDVFAIVIGFFGPYFLLPRAFRWGGSIMSAATGAINNAVQPVTKAGREGIKGMGERYQGKWAKDYDPDDAAFGIARRTRKIPFTNKTFQTYGLGGRVVRRVQSGHMLPTERSRRLTIAAGDKWSSERNEEISAVAARRREKATAKERDIGAGKQAAMRMVEEGLMPGADKRIAQAGIRDLIRSNSFYELANSTIIDPTDGREKYIWQTDVWRDTVAGDGELYGKVAAARPDWAPHRLPSGLPKYRGEIEPDVNRITERLKLQMQSEGKSETEISAELPARVQKEVNRVQAENKLLQGNENVQYATALSDVVGEMDARQLSNISPVFYQRIAQMAEEGQRLKAMGQEDIGNRLMAPAVELGNFFERLARSGGTFNLASITGASETQQLIDSALRAGGHSDLESIITTQGRGQPEPETESKSGRRSTGWTRDPGGGYVMNARSGAANTGGFTVELPISHDEPTEPPAPPPIIPPDTPPGS